jgi:hypothetical protein
MEICRAAAKLDDEILWEVLKPCLPFGQEDVPRARTTVSAMKIVGHKRE